MSKDDIKENIKKYIPYIVIALIYYLMPAFLAIDTGSAIFILLLIIPSIVFLTAILFSKKQGFKWYFSVIVAILWLPNIFIFNDSITVYAYKYALISIIGQLIGMSIRKNKKKDKL